MADGKIDMLFQSACDSAVDLALSQLQNNLVTAENFEEWRAQIANSFSAVWKPVASLWRKKAIDNAKRDELRAIHGLAYDRVITNEIYRRLTDAWRAEYEKNRYEESLNIEVDGVAFKALKRIDVLWQGWESDEYAWLVEDNGVKRIVMTNHGQHMFVDTAVLQNKIEMYQQAIEDSKQLIQDVVGEPTYFSAYFERA